MSITFTSTNPGTSADYGRYLYDQPVKNDVDGDAILLDFTLANTDASFVKLTRGNYIKITSSTYPVWYTGYITSDPQYVYLGEKNHIPHWGFKYEASSDEIILSQNALGILPPFMNMTQGQIIKSLAQKIAPDFFDVSNISDGMTIARYVVDPTQKFSDVVKAFATAAVYRFYGQNQKLYFIDKTTIPQGLAVNGSALHFTPADLTVQASADIPIINDALVMGNIEPQRYTTEYFVGSGFDGQYSLSASVFGVESVILLDDDFSNTGGFDSSKWTVYDEPANYLQVSNGYLNVVGGMGDSLYSVHLDSVSTIQLGGAMRIAHGEFDFVPQTTDNLICGVICAFWTQAPNSSYTGCVYGLEVSKSSGVVTVKPIIDGVVQTAQAQIVDTNGAAGAPPMWDTTVSYLVGANVTYNGQFYVCYNPTAPGVNPLNTAYWAIAVAKRYVLRTIISSQTIYPTTQSYVFMDASGVRHSIDTPPAPSSVMSFYTYITELDPNTGLITPGFPLIWTNAFSPSDSQVYANYIMAASNDLHITVTGLTISTPMQATLGLQEWSVSGFINKLVGPNEIDATDGLAPYATISQSGGKSQKQNVLGTPQYSLGSPTLSFFKDTSALTTTVPQKGDVVRLSYRSAGAALGRARDNASVSIESKNWQDAGIRSSVRGDLNPLPMTAAECEAAAAAIIGQNAYTHYEGNYIVPSQNVTSEPVAGALLPFTNLTSDFPVTSFVEPIHQVQTTLLAINGSEEFFSHTITFGLKGDSQRLLKVLSGFSQQSDIFTTIDTAQVPAYVPTASVGLAYAADITNPRMDITNGGLYSPWVASTAYTLGQMVIDANGNLQKVSTAGTSSSSAPTWANAENAVVPIGSVVTSSSVGLTSNVLTIISPVLVTGMLNIGTELFMTTFTTATWLNGFSIEVATIGDDGYTFTANFTHANYPAAADTGTLTVTASGGLSLQTHDGSTLVWSLVGHAYGVDANGFYYDMGQAPPTGGSFEVRYSDDSWGCDDAKNLAGRFTTQTFSLSRLHRNSLVFVKAQDGRNRLISSEDWTKQATGTLYGYTQWNGNTPIVLVPGIDPDGNLSLLNEKNMGSSSSDSLINQLTAQNVVAGQPFCFSVSLNGSRGDWIKLELSFQSVTTTQFIQLTGRWQRVSITNVVTTTSATGVGPLVTMLQVGSGEVAGYTPPTTLTIYGTRAALELNTAAESIYCKTIGASNANYPPNINFPYGANSRYAACVDCHYPLPPQPPTAFVDTTDPGNPIINMVLPDVADDVWGLELRASDNVTVLYHDDLTDSGYSGAYTVVNNTSRSLQFYVYTYNLLGEYSASYAVSSTIPSPSLVTGSLVVDDATKTLMWSGVNASSYLVQVDAISISMAAEDIMDSNTVTAQSWLLNDNDFFGQRWFSVTPLDDIGPGTPLVISHDYSAPAPPTGVPFSGVNNRSGWTIEAVESARSAYPATNVLDGNINSYWSSANGQTSWIEIAFGSSQTFSAVQMTNRTNSFDGAPETFYIYTSNDGITWTQQGTLFSGLNNLKGVCNTYNLPSSVTANHLKIGIQTSYNSTSNVVIAEIFTLQVATITVVAPPTTPGVITVPPEVGAAYQADYTSYVKQTFGIASLSTT